LFQDVPWPLPDSFWHASKNPKKIQALVWSSRLLQRGFLDRRGQILSATVGSLYVGRPCVCRLRFGTKKALYWCKSFQDPIKTHKLKYRHYPHDLVSHDSHLNETVFGHTRTCGRGIPVAILKRWNHSCENALCFSTECTYMFLKNFSLICLALNRAPRGFGPNFFSAFVWTGCCRLDT